MVVSEDGHTLRMMKGRDGTISTGKTLHTVLETLQESFDPIVSSTDGQDLLPSMVLSIEHGDFDFQVRRRAPGGVPGAGGRRSVRGRPRFCSAAPLVAVSPTEEGGRLESSPKQGRGCLLRPLRLMQRRLTCVLVCRSPAPRPAPRRACTLCCSSTAASPCARR